MTVPDEDRDPLDEIAEDFLQRRRAGSYPSVSEYVARVPERAEEVRELLSALVMVEELKPDPDLTIGQDSPRLAVGKTSIPEQVGEFRIIREIGRGGMGIVYEAEQESLGRRVALKVLYPRASQSDVHVRRFLREARLAARLHHTNIVQVFGVGRSDNLHYYSMQFIKGLGLDKVMDDLRRLDARGLPEMLAQTSRPPSSGSSPTDVALSLAGDGPPDFIESDLEDRQAALPGSAPHEALGDTGRRYMVSVARIGVQASEALEYAHKLGTLHRDIKPSNLLLDAHGTVWVTDFGLAKALEDENLTESRDLVGTLRYMSPERFRGQCDARSDVYALGLTLYEMIALRPVFDARDRPALVHQIAHVEPVALHKIDPGIPRDLETIIAKTIEKVPADRYQSASALAADLRRFVEDRPIEARPVSTTERLVRWARRNPGVAALAGTVMLLLALIAVGASIAAVQLDIKHRDALLNLSRAERAQDSAQRRLWESILDHARAVRRSGTIGQRFEGLRVLSGAAALGVYPEKTVALRDEAVACLALADLGTAWTRQLPPGTAAAPVAVDPAFTRYAFPDSKGAVQVIRVETGETLLELAATGPVPTALRFSRDGRFLGVAYDAGDNPEFIVWDLEHQTPRLRSIRGVNAAAFDFHPSRDIVATGHRDGTVRLHDLVERVEIRQLTVGAIPHALSFDPRGTRLAVGCVVDDLAVQVIDLDTIEKGATVRHAVPGGAYAVAWHPDSDRLCAAGPGTQIHLLRAKPGSAVNCTMTGHYGAVVALAIHPNGEVLASGSWDGTIRLWDIRTGHQLLQGPLPDAGLLGFSSDGRFLGPRRDGPELSAWEVETGGQCRSLVAGPELGLRTWSIDFRGSGDLMVSAGEAGLRLDSPERGEPLATARLTWNVASLFEPDGRHLLTSGRNGLERWPIVSLPSDQGPRLRIGPPRPIGLPPGLPTERICIAADGRTLAVVLDRERGRVAIVDLQGSAAPVTFGDHPGAERLSFSRDAQHLATGTWKGTGVKIWKTSDGSLVRTIPEEGSCDVVYSPDGGKLLTGSSDTYRLWDAGTGALLRQLPRRHAGGQPGKGAFSHDGSLMAISPTRNLVQLVEVATGRELVTLEPPDPRHIASMGFSPDGTLLAITFNDETILLWDLSSIRRALGELGLDWDPPRDAAGKAQTEADPAVPPRIEIVPHPADSALVRADQLAASGDVQGAAAAFAQAIELGRLTPSTALSLAVLRQMAGDAAEYRQLCRPLLDRFGTELSPDIANTLAWACALGPGALEDYTPAIRLAERAVASGAYTFRLNTLGAILYRAGRYDEAIARLRQAVARHGSGGTADDWVLLALAEERRGNHDLALQWLRKIDQALADDGAQLRTLGRAPWRQRLGLQVLHAEARALIEPPSAVPEPAEERVSNP